MASFAPDKNGIYSITKDKKKLVEEIKRLGKQKPGWYNESQIVYVTNGPYKWQYIVRKQHLLDEIRRLYKKKKFNTYLDLGCGDGVNLKDIVDEFGDAFDIYGIDYNYDRLVRAKHFIKNKNVSLVHVDINEDVIRPNSFDVILFNHVLEHIHDDEGALKKVHSYLKRGAHLILGIPQEGILYFQFRDRVLEPYIMWKTDHVQFYTEGSISEKLKKHKFKIEKVVRMNYAFPHSIIDKHLRKYKRIHDVFERVGSRFAPGIAGALQITCEK